MLVQQIVNGLTLSSMYALIALGYTLFFGVIGIVNFAHGDVYMIGAFAGLVTLLVLEPLQLHFSLLIVAGLLVSTAVCGVLGALVERFTLRPLRGAPSLAALVSSLGTGLVLRELILIYYPDGANPKPFPPLVPKGAFEVAGGIIQHSQLFIFALTTVLVVALHYYVTRTKSGRAMRAAAQNAEMAGAMGIKVNQVIFVTFFIGSALGAVAGFMNGMFYQQIRFDMGFIAGMKGFTAAVLGGLGNMYGALLGALTLGFLEVIGTVAFPQGAQYKDVFAFTLLVAFLVFRPQGILSGLATEKV